MSKNRELTGRSRDVDHGIANHEQELALSELVLFILYAAAMVRGRRKEGQEYVRQLLCQSLTELYHSGSGYAQSQPPPYCYDRIAIGYLRERYGYQATGQVAEESGQRELVRTLTIRGNEIDVRVRIEVNEAEELLLIPRGDHQHFAKRNLAMARKQAPTIFQHGIQALVGEVTPFAPHLAQAVLATASRGWFFDSEGALISDIIEAFEKEYLGFRRFCAVWRDRNP